MTGYNVAHGDTAAVKLILDNTREFSERYQELIDGHCVWSDSAGWKGASRAARGIQYYVKHISRRAGVADEIRDAKAVDYTEIVSDELSERNVQAGRAVFAGLTHNVYRDGKRLTALMSEDDCWTWVLHHSSMSVDWAIRHEGYEIRAAK